MRMNTLVSRHDEFDSQESLIILQSLKLGKPYLDGRYKHEVLEYIKTKKSETEKEELLKDVEDDKQN